MAGDLPRGDAGEVEALATGEDGGRKLEGFGGGQDEDHAGRRLFQGLEQGVERLVGEHVDFVDDVDLRPSARGRVAGILAQLAHLVDAAVRGPVDLQHVHAPAAGDLPAGVAFIAGNRGRALLAVQGLGQDAGGGGLSHSARPAEEIGVGHPPRGDGVSQGAGHVLLAHHVLEHLGAVLSRQDEIGHGFPPRSGAADGSGRRSGRKRVVHLLFDQHRAPTTNGQLRPGTPTAHRGNCLPLLPSGPDGVHKPRLRRTWPSTPPSSVVRTPDAGLEQEFSPAIADCGYRAPLTPRLARPRTIQARFRPGRFPGGAARIQRRADPGRLFRTAAAGLIGILVEMSGIEPPTSSLRTRRSPI